MLQESSEPGTIRSLSIKSNGLLSFSSKRVCTGRFVHVKFVNKIFDFIFPKDLYGSLIQSFEPSKSLLFASLKFGWSYTPNVRTILYKPRDVFLDFDYFESPCICHLQKFHTFCKDISPFGFHVLTTDLSICNQKELETLLSKGFNHIPHKLVNPWEAFEALLDGWK